MKYTVNYTGAFFYDDSDEFNSHEYNSFEDAFAWLYSLCHTGFKDAYLVDEKNECSLHWDIETQEFYWN